MTRTDLETSTNILHRNKCIKSTPRLKRVINWFFVLKIVVMISIHIFLMLFRLTKLQKCFIIIFIIFCFPIVFLANKLLHELRNSSKSDYIKNILVNGEKRNRNRLENIERTCNHYNLGMYRNNSRKLFFKEPPTPQYEVFYYDLENKLTWCPIYKAGSSTWLYNFALLGGATEEQISKIKMQLSELVRSMFPSLDGERAKKALKNSLKFLIVRHPFERILSAYRDKLENAVVRGKDGTYHFYRSFGQKIVMKYRLGGNNTNIRQILKPNQYIWNEIKEPLGVEPSFKEFVRYLIDLDLKTRADDHWIPYYLFCTPCMVKYDIIGKLETMREDQEFIILKAGLNNKIAPNWRHKTNPFNDRNGGYVSEIAKVYFSQLNRIHLDKLYEKYELDFKLFQYEKEEYYHYVKDIN